MTNEIVTDKEFLRKVSFDTDWGDIGSLDLINKLREANNKSSSTGCGLTAVQIGYHLRFAWYRLGEIEHTLMNPKIIEFKGKCKAVNESCLSINKKVKKQAHENHKLIIVSYHKIKKTTSLNANKGKYK